MTKVNLKRPSVLFCVLSLLVLARPIHAGESCLKYYYNEMDFYSKMGRIATFPLASCSFVGLAIFPPVGIPLSVVTAITAGTGHFKFSKYAQVKRVILGAYSFLGKKIPSFVDTDRRSREYIRKSDKTDHQLVQPFLKYFNKIRGKVSMTPQELATLIVESDRKLLFCPEELVANKKNEKNEEKLVVKAMNFKKFNLEITNGRLKEKLLDLKTKKHN